jgi:hypothetical protein
MHLAAADLESRRVWLKGFLEIFNEKERSVPELGIHPAKEQGFQWDGTAREGRTWAVEGCCMFKRRFLWKTFLSCRYAELKFEEEATARGWSE